MGIDAGHLRLGVIRPTLKLMGHWSPEAEELLLGTAAQESHLGKYLYQLGGPAKGIYQMEPETHDDLMINYLRYRPGLEKVITVLASPLNGTTSVELIGNLFYATAMARVHYLRKPDPIPRSLGEQAAYWKKHYNTHLGAGTEEEYIRNYNRLIKGEP